MRNQLTEDKPTLFISQYGDKYMASSVKELCAKAGYAAGTARKQYCDKPDGSVVWNGYVVGQHWFTAFKWAEVPA